MKFGYLKDPLFLLCFAAYFGLRVLAAYDLSTPLLRSYLNDVVCLPFWVPIMLWTQRRVGWRSHDGPPQVYEVVIPLVLWSIVFEAILPDTPAWSGRAIADPLDVLCYTLGAAVALHFWNWYYAAALRPLAQSASDGP
jgi:hypothetical protein